jgi:hypothetical protein
VVVLEALSALPVAQMVDAVVELVVSVAVQVVLDRSVEMAELFLNQVIMHTVLSRVVEEVWEVTEEMVPVPVEDRVEQDKHFRWEEPPIW